MSATQTGLRCDLHPGASSGDRPLRGHHSSWSQPRCFVTSFHRLSAKAKLRGGSRFNVPLKITGESALTIIFVLILVLILVLAQGRGIVWLTTQLDPCLAADQIAFAAPTRVIVVVRGYNLGPAHFGPVLQTFLERWIPRTRNCDKTKIPNFFAFRISHFAGMHSTK